MSGTNLFNLLLQLYTFVQLFKEKLRINILKYVTNIYFWLTLGRCPFESRPRHRLLRL